MKKTLSLVDQVKEAIKEVESWPDSVKSVTDLRHSDFFQDVDDSERHTQCSEASFERKIPVSV